MKTLILYASKHGAAREIAQRIADKTGNAVIHDLKQNGVPAVSGFDCVIIGSSLYAGMIRKEAKSFLSRHANELRGKKLGLFLSGLEPEHAGAYFENNFPLIQAQAVTCFPGGIYDPQKAGRLDKLMLKAVGKQMEYTDTIDDEKIAQFVEELRK